MSLAYSEERADELAENIAGVQAQILETRQSLGDGAQEVRLVAVSKLKPSSDILAAYQRAGHRHFGENYVCAVPEIAMAPYLVSGRMEHDADSLNVLMSSRSKNWKQRAKSEQKATALNKACVNVGRPEPLRIFLQVNTSGEESKSGMEPGDVVNVARHVKLNCPSLRLAGLMTIGSPNPDLENGENPDFKALNGCRTAIYEEKELNISDLELSMGMSDDFQRAILQGSTNIRVGSTIFGSRPPKSSA
ncbi:hypothetical protein BGX34_008279 [Mortierella sp. NVP85]|nr:hypothetical protein BGX34_008279 [Mortierella sp. NVP85]